MFRARCIGRDVGQIDFGLLRGRQLDLGLFRGVFEALQGEHVFPKIDALFFLELVAEVVHQALIEIFATEEGVAVGGEHFELVFAIDCRDFDDRDIEGAAAKVIHRDLAVTFFFIHAEGEGRGRRFVDDALDIKARNATGVLGGLALRVIEIGGHCDDGFSDGFAEIIFGGLFHFHQNLRRHFRRRDFFVAHFDPGVVVAGLDNPVGHQVDVLLHFFFFEAATDQAFDGVERVFGVGHCLALGRGADQHFTVFGVGDDRRRGTRAFRIFNDFRLAAFHDGDAGVGGAQIDTDNF